MADQASEVVNEVNVADVADQQPAQPAVQPDQFKELLATITAEDGRQKYDSVEKALKSLPHANEHISRLEQEMKELKEELVKRKTAEEIIDRLEQSKSKATEETPQPSVDLSQIESLINNTITQKERAKMAEQNINSVVSTLNKTYGEKAEEVFYSKAAEAGLSVAEINELAKKSPKAALKIAGINEGQSSIPSKISSSVDTERLGQHKAQEQSTKLPAFPNNKQLVSAWKAAKPV